MSAREIMARFIAEGWARSPMSGNLTADDYLAMGGAQKQADILAADLSAAGYRIVGPGEVDGETLERAAATVDEEWRKHGGLNCTHACAAIRALATRPRDEGDEK